MFDFLTLSELYTQIISKFKQLIISSGTLDRANLVEVLIKEFIKINAAFKTPDFLEDQAQPPPYLQLYVEYESIKNEISFIKNTLTSIEENLQKYEFANNQKLAAAANQLTNLAAKEKSLKEIDTENPLQKILTKDGVIYSTPKFLIQLMICFYKKSCKHTHLFLENTNSNTTAGELKTGASDFLFNNEAINDREDELNLLLQYQQDFSLACSEINKLDAKNKSFIINATKELNMFICAEKIEPAAHKVVIQKILSRTTNIANAALIKNINCFIVTHINLLEFQHSAYDELKNLKKRLSKTRSNSESNFNSNSNSSYNSVNSYGTSQFFHYQSADEESDDPDEATPFIDTKKKKKSSCLVM